MTAKRFNTGKTDLTLLPPEACEEEAKVWMWGEKKYGRDNWRKLWGDNTVNVALASLLRHAFSLLRGEANDTESGLNHAAHIRCNAAMIIEYYAHKAETAEAEIDKFYEVEFTQWKPFYGGEELGYTERCVVASKDLTDFLEANDTARVIKQVKGTENV